MENQTFWFDNIQYLPSTSVPLDQAAIIVDNLDSQLQYGTGWGPLVEGAVDVHVNITAVAGSVFHFDFIGMQTDYCCFSHTASSSRILGVSLSWYGIIPVEFPFTSSQATYSIDGETPTNFLLKGLPVNSTSDLNNQLFFETALLSPTSHTLEVVYEGTNSTPLTLDYLIIQNGTSSSSTMTSISSLPTSTGNIASASIPVGSIVGGVIGGLVLVVFAILGFFLLRRRQKRDVHQPLEYTLLSPATPNPSSSHSSAYSQVPQTVQLGSRETRPETGPGQVLRESDLRVGPGSDLGSLALADLG